ncbi:MAG: hypothetical protein BWX88_00221 [Planctomycetes bacterium ADurb.Bin126]|nr:MAG: hypothetical protein BWX88_00221 [Planctomycetes bacterium ADurb.Bin126]HOD80645.1 hypothetical protein [Phycisphaerae bacterium]HQL73909.1 hypothetical protein [Phycisphaerae bacterium]
MTTGSEQAAAPVPRTALWRGGGVLFLLVCLASLAVGIWPGLVYPTRLAFPAAPLPALRTLAAGLVLHALLIYPLVLMRRLARSRPAGAPENPPSQTPDGATTNVPDGATTNAPDGVATSVHGGFVAATACELLAFAIAGGPFFLVAAYLGDAVVSDVLRVLLCLSGVYAAGWAIASRLARSPGGRSVSVLAGALLALGLPAAYYLALEFAPAGAAHRVLYDLAPVTFLWSQAASRLAFWPQPLWPVAVYVALAAAAVLVGWAMNRRA